MAGLGDDVRGVPGIEGTPLAKRDQLRHLSAWSVAADFRLTRTRSSFGLSVARNWRIPDP
jgi:hypothetical protein